jgi:hypothetical protein
MFKHIISLDKIIHEFSTDILTNGKAIPVTGREGP